MVSHESEQVCPKGDPEDLASRMRGAKGSLARERAEVPKARR